MNSAAEVLARIRCDLPPERVAPPSFEGVYRYMHIATSWGGSTFEEAFAGWRNDLFPHIDQHRPDWIWWRVKPEVECQTNFASGEPEWVIHSRCAFPARKKE